MEPWIGMGGVPLFATNSLLGMVRAGEDVSAVIDVVDVGLEGLSAVSWCFWERRRVRELMEDTEG